MNPPAAMLAQWDELVSQCSDSDITQLSGWAVVRRTAGYEPLYLLARQGEQLVGGALVLTTRLPLLGRVGYVSYGPLISDEAPRAVVLPALADALEGLARRRLRAMFVQPIDGQDVSAALLARGFRKSSAGVAPATTIRIDLSPTEEELRAGLSKRVRRWTGKWERSGVTVRRGGEDDLELLSGLIRRTAEYQGFSELSPEYVRNLYLRFAEQGHAEIFVGEVAGEAVAAELFTTCGAVLRCRLTGLDRSSEAVRLSVTSALDWEAMKWAKANGLTEFDMGGLTPAAAAAIGEQGFSSADLDGATRFKVGFGGRLHHYPPAVEMISSPVLRKGYDLLGSASGGRALRERARQRMRQGTKPLD